MKNENYNYYLGIDVSKAKLDVALSSLAQNGIVSGYCFENSKKGLKALTSWLKGQGVLLQDVLFCMEHTGIYCCPLQNYLTKHSCFIWMESAVRIQRSNGLQRGKNDSIDAKRIALYAMKNRADKVQWISINEGQVKLKDLMNLRKRLIQTKNALLAPIKELMSVEEKQRARMIQKNCNQSISSLINEISKVDQEIKKEMNKDVAISKNVKLLLSIPGVGMITSVAMVCATDNFTRFNDAKKLACHCGCAPFEHSSGTSIRGKNRVHFMANKELKTLLTLGATSIINSKNDMAIYYKRKVEEGKNKMSVINALRNKLVHRIISVIKRQSPYLPHINMLSQTIS